MPQLSIIVTGDLNGSFKGAYEKVLELSGKLGKPFDVWFCLGDMTSTKSTEEDRKLLMDVVRGKTKVETPVYFCLRKYTSGMDMELLGLSMSGALPTNVHILPPSGMTKLANGLKVAFISGMEDISDQGRQYKMTKEDLSIVSDMIRKNDNCCDLLFSSEWPQSILHGSSLDGVTSSLAGSAALSKLIKTTPSRYHFCTALKTFVEREPFESPFVSFARFINLAPLGSGHKDFYAFKIVPMSDPDFVPTAAKRPANITSSPWVTETHQPNHFFSTSDTPVTAAPIPDKGTVTKQPPAGYICKRCKSSEHFYQDCPHLELGRASTKTKYICHICHEPGHNIRHCPKKTSNVQADVTKDDCWFCLANPAVRKHLIIDIGEEVYVALARGGLDSKHILLIPIEHIPAVGGIPSSVATELAKYKTQITNALAPLNLEPLFVTLKLNASHHFHTQCFQLPKGQSSAFVAFINKFCQEKHLSPLVKSGHEGNSYCLMELGNGESFFIPIEAGAYFPAQVGREAVVSFLQLDSRKMDWKACLLNQEEEIRDVKAYKDILNKPF